MMEDMSASLSGSPGSHPHSDRPNWRPGDDDADEFLVQKIADALREGKSERQFAKLLGLSRMKLWRGRMMAKIPEPLFERLLAAGYRSSRILAAIGRALQDGEFLRGEVECCPNCGHTLRVRPDTPQAAIKIVADWLGEQEAREP
jgi:hypothetical protein